MCLVFWVPRSLGVLFGSEQTLSRFLNIITIAKCNKKKQPISETKQLLHCKAQFAQLLKLGFLFSLFLISFFIQNSGQRMELIEVQTPFVVYWQRIMIFGENKYIEFHGLLVNSVEILLKINNQTLISIMDIEFALSNQNPSNIFRPIEHFPVQLLYQQPIVLENAFSQSSTNTNQTLLLTLINNTLLLSNPLAFDVRPYAGVTLDFELKFQVIYQVEKNIFSSKQGIKIFYDEHTHFSFYSRQNSIIQAWILCLSRIINRKGFHEMFKPLKKLGKGNFASVYQVERATDGARFAVKAFSKQNCFSTKNGKESLINQLSIMRELSSDPHKNVLKLQGVYQSDNSIYVVLELLTGGQLFHRIQQKNGYFKPSEIKQFMFGLLSGLAQMHSQRIMHRDLKPQNIMLRSQSSMQPVIVDFGLATNADIEKYLFFRCGTPGYVAPEIIELNQNKHIEPQCDIFSAGAIFHILLTRKAIFEGSKYDEVYKKNKEMKINLSGDRYANLQATALSLLRKMLVANPQQRITAVQALNHPYFSEVRQMQLSNEKRLNSPCLTKSSSKRGSVIYK